MLRAKPERYYTIPEPILNRIFGEIHDVAQFIVVQVQKVAIGEDVTKTFIVRSNFNCCYCLILCAQIC
jgi:hypothetical protein